MRVSCGGARTKESVFIPYWSFSFKSTPEFSSSKGQGLNPIVYALSSVLVCLLACLIVYLHLEVVEGNKVVYFESSDLEWCKGKGAQTWNWDLGVLSLLALLFKPILSFRDCCFWSFMQFQ